MSCDSTFSSPMVLEDGWFLEKDIEECRIIDFPENDTLMIDKSEDVIENNVGEYEMLNLFGEEND